MPLLKEIEYGMSTKIGVWEITESIDELKWKLHWGQSDIKKFNEIKLPGKSLQWLATRLLIRMMLGDPPFIDLQVDEFGKPYLKNRNEKISISHSEKLAVVILSNYDCGIDVQKMTIKVEAIHEKFMSRIEISSLTRIQMLEQMHLYWCGKEALYKMYGRKKLNFISNLSIDSFILQKKGVVGGNILKDSYQKRALINYELIQDYMLAWVTSEPSND